MPTLKEIFAPLKVNTVEVKNRVFMAPMGTNLATVDGHVTQELIDYLVARARGGVGLIITEVTMVDARARYIGNSLGLFDDSHIPGWRKLAEAVHLHGTKIMPQLIHPSFAAREALNRIQPVAASPLAHYFYREIPRELTVEEIQEIIERFAEAARRAKEAGCDGVEIHAAHCHGLLGGFLSPLHNKRSDEYGGDLNGRMKIVLETVRRVRSKVGRDFIISVRISGEEDEPGGQTLHETIYLARCLEEAGVDLLHVSGGSFFTPSRGGRVIPPTGAPRALNAAQARAIKQSVGIPVACVGRITDPWIAETVVSTGCADAVVIGRALLCDPEFVNKAAKNQVEEIRPCIGCLNCLTQVLMDNPIACSVNVDAGKEGQGSLQRAAQPKKVLVIGGGPGGLEAARVAAQRGHEVTLMEKSAKLGGQFLLAAVPPGKQELAVLTRYLVNQVYKAGVKVELNKEVTLETVTEFAPDAVIVATGGVPLLPQEIAGLEREIVVTAWDVLSGKVLVGPEVVVIGGGVLGCETANFLAHPVRDRAPGAVRVTVLEMQDNVAMDDLTFYRSWLVTQLYDKGVNIVTNARVSEILQDGVRYTVDGQEQVLRGIDNVVLAVGVSPQDALARELKNLPVPVYVIGDAKKPRRVRDAIAEANKVARDL
jgi:2,4-dienoyl-CoA reductase-like NADH-dependent reductase (Old Yellow Enzyme family)/thioredoxin reductase